MATKAFRRSPRNVQPLQDMEVLISFAKSPVIGLLGLVNDDWVSAGILNDGSKIDVTRTMDEETVSGIGFGVVARKTKPGDLKATFETLEDNATTRYIAWPDSALTKDGVLVKFHSGKVAEGYVAFVYVQQDGIVQIDVTRHPATLKMENVGRGESVEGRQVEVGIIPGDDKDVLETRWYKVQEDGTMVDITSKMFVKQSEITGKNTRQLGGGKPAEVAEIQAEFSAEKPESSGTPSGTPSGTEASHTA